MIICRSAASAAIHGAGVAIGCHRHTWLPCGCGRVLPRPSPQEFSLPEGLTDALALASPPPCL